MLASSFATSSVAEPVLAQGPALGCVRLLLPVVDEPDAGWSREYALQRHRNGQRVEVCLLHVAQRLQYCEVFRSGHEPDAPAPFDEPSSHLLLQFARPLVDAGVPVRCVLAAGGAVEAILEMAERLACDEIILPLNDRPGFLGGFWHRNTVRYVQERERGVPVVTVDEAGRPVSGMHARQRPS